MQKNRWCLLQAMLLAMVDGPMYHPHSPANSNIYLVSPMVDQRHLLLRRTELCQGAKAPHPSSTGTSLLEILSIRLQQATITFQLRTATRRYIPPQPAVLLLRMAQLEIINIRN